MPFSSEYSKPRTRHFLFTIFTVLPLVSGCLPTGSGGGGGGVVIIGEGDAGQLDSGANNTSPTTKTCSDGSAVPIAQACSCPTSAADCDDGDPCTAEVFTSGNTCGTCSSSIINACGPFEGCCPSQCSAQNDQDCTGCGNGVIDDSESCDGDCPNSCPRTEGCIGLTFTGSPETCDVACVEEIVTACVDDDGCCAPGCTSRTDSDCEPLEIGDPCADVPEACEDSGDDFVCLTQDDSPDLPAAGICASATCGNGSVRCDMPQNICVSFPNEEVYCIRGCLVAECTRDDTQCESNAFCL